MQTILAVIIASAVSVVATNLIIRLVIARCEIKRTNAVKNAVAEIINENQHRHPANILTRVLEYLERV